MEVLKRYDTMVAISISWIPVSLSIEYVFLNHKDLVIPQARDIAHRLNFMYSIANMIAFIWLSHILFVQNIFLSPLYYVCHNLDVEEGHSSLEYLYNIYYLSKIYEYLDIILYIVGGLGSPHIHFRIHHATTLSMAWVIATSRSSHGALFMLCNIFMHIFTSLYFSGATSGVNFFGNKYMMFILRFWGHIQLLVGIVTCSVAIYWRSNGYDGCAGTLDMDKWSLFLYSCYFLLYRKEISDGKKEK